VLHFASPSSVAGAVPNSAGRTLSTAVLMSSSHRLLITHSPYLPLYYFLNVLNAAHSLIQGVVLKLLLYASSVSIQSLKHSAKPL
jgi:hypothetical protein